MWRYLTAGVCHARLLNVHVRHVRGCTYLLPLRHLALRPYPCPPSLATLGELQRQHAWEADVSKKLPVILDRNTLSTSALLKDSVLSAARAVHTQVVSTHPWLCSKLMPMQVRASVPINSQDALCLCLTQATLSARWRLAEAAEAAKRRTERRRRAQGTAISD